MPLHIASAPSSAPHRRLPPLNIMRSLSLCRKSRPTCTLSLAHVSACKPTPPSGGSPDQPSALQVDNLQLDVHFVAVPVPSKPLRRTKTTTKTKTKTTTATTTTLNDINVIPFPTSAQTATTPVGPISHTNSSFKCQKKEDLDHSPSAISSSVSPPRKRARKGSLSSPPPSSSRSGAPSARARALARVPPARPSTPTPDYCQSDDAMETGDKCPVQHSPADPRPDSGHHQQPSQGQHLDKPGQSDLPPYSPSPPPYSPPVVVSPVPIPVHVPIAVVPLSAPSSPTSRPLPPSPPPPPPPPPSPSPPPRKPRISPSELKFFIFLYRTLVSGLESRQRNRSNTQVRRARDWSRREQHLDGVLIEVDDDDIAMDNDEPTPSLNEDLEMQDALLALRLRGFLKWNGVDEWVLKVDSSSSSNSNNPFLDDGGVEKMDVDVQHDTPPIISSRHLITVLRMRGTCGPRQGPGLGIKNRREQSKLRNCCYRVGDDEDEDM